jgi:hypothetical protein
MGILNAVSGGEDRIAERFFPLLTTSVGQAKVRV